MLRNYGAFIQLLLEGKLRRPATWKISTIQAIVKEKVRKQGPEPRCPLGSSHPTFLWKPQNLFPHFPIFISTAGCRLRCVRAQRGGTSASKQGSPTRAACKYLPSLSLSAVSLCPPLNLDCRTKSLSSFVCCNGYLQSWFSGFWYIHWYAFLSRFGYPDTRVHIFYHTCLCKPPSGRYNKNMLKKQRVSCPPGGSHGSSLGERFSWWLF